MCFNFILFVPVIELINKLQLIDIGLCFKVFYSKIIVNGQHQVGNAHIAGLHSWVSTFTRLSVYFICSSICANSFWNHQSAGLAAQSAGDIEYQKKLYSAAGIFL
jgi:hypothetical protein